MKTITIRFEQAGERPAFHVEVSTEGVHFQMNMAVGHLTLTDEEMESINLVREAMQATSF